MSGLDKVDSFRKILANYMTSVDYNTASRVTSVNLANGVNETYSCSSRQRGLAGNSEIQSGRRGEKR